MNTDELIEKYLNERYADSNIEFFVHGLHLTARYKGEWHEEVKPYVEANTPLPYIDKISEEYASSLHGRCIEPIIKSITRHVKERKNTIEENK